MSKEITTKAGFAKALDRIQTLDALIENLRAKEAELKSERDDVMSEATAYATLNVSAIAEQKKTNLFEGDTDKWHFKIAYGEVFERTKTIKSSGLPAKLTDSAWLNGLYANEETKPYLRTKLELNKQKLKDDFSPKKFDEAEQGEEQTTKDERLSAVFGLKRVKTVSLTIHKPYTGTAEEALADAEDFGGEE